ncbi:MAG: phosphoenolpyruvate synthase regulatory protein [Betaproteobacteria bacterium]|nr:phosphoenolpyruvate synthase regulatory protein [Betaproteobacteria bacterium]
MNQSVDAIGTGIALQPDTNPRSLLPAGSQSQSQSDKPRTVFYVSDGTGITAEGFGHSLLAQFEKLAIREIRLPFIDSLPKAREALEKINRSSAAEAARPLVFSTLVNPEIAAVLRQANAFVINLFASFVEPLEQELGMKSTHTIGRLHNVADSQRYKNRIEAINFSLAHDDGQSAANLKDADVILVGVSRSGKTPTSLYLAMQHGLKAANYPLIPEDFERKKLPPAFRQRRKFMHSHDIKTPMRAHGRTKRLRRPHIRTTRTGNTGLHTKGCGSPDDCSQITGILNAVEIEPIRL